MQHFFSMSTQKLQFLKCFLHKLQYSEYVSTSSTTYVREGAAALAQNLYFFKYVCAHTAVITSLLSKYLSHSLI